MHKPWAGRDLCRSSRAASRAGLDACQQRAPDAVRWDVGQEHPSTWINGIPIHDIRVKLYTRPRNTRSARQEHDIRVNIYIQPRNNPSARQENQVCVNIYIRLPNNRSARQEHDIRVTSLHPTTE